MKSKIKPYLCFQTNTGGLSHGTTTQVLPHRDTNVFRTKEQTLFIHRQDGTRVPHHAFRLQIRISQPSAPFRQVITHQYPAGLFRRQERTVQRTGYRKVGNGMDGISRVAFRHEHGQAFGQGGTGTLPVVATEDIGKEFRHRI